MLLERLLARHQRRQRLDGREPARALDRPGAGRTHARTSISGSAAPPPVALRISASRADTALSCSWLASMAAGNSLRARQNGSRSASRW